MKQFTDEVILVGPTLGGIILLWLEEGNFSQFYYLFHFYGIFNLIVFIKQWSIYCKVKDICTTKMGAFKRSETTV